MNARLAAKLCRRKRAQGVPRLLGHGLDAIIQRGTEAVTNDGRRGRYERACFVLNVAHRSPASHLLWKVRLTHGALIRKTWREGCWPPFRLLQGWRTRSMESAL